MLSGSSSVVKDDPYIMTIYVPKGFRFKTAKADGEDIEAENLKRTSVVRITSSATRTVSWRIAFAE